LICSARWRIAAQSISFLSEWRELGANAIYNLHKAAKPFAGGGEITTTIAQGKPAAAVKAKRAWGV
jgi:hypothetical protein